MLLIALALTMSIRISSGFRSIPDYLPEEYRGVVQRDLEARDRFTTYKETELRKFYGYKQWILFGGGIALGIGVGLYFGDRKRNAEAHNSCGSSVHSQ
jgi:hypothetical protein